MFDLSNLPMFWLQCTIILLVIEWFTQGLTTIWFAGGSLVALLLAVCNVSFVVQVIVFLVVSVLLLMNTRKIFVDKLRTGKEKTNVEALVGEVGVVQDEIKPLEPGRVLLNGMSWSALSTNEERIEKGVEVRVRRIEGVKLIVKPINSEEKGE